MIYQYRNYIVFLFGLTMVFYYLYETKLLFTKNVYVTTTYEKHLEEWKRIPSCPALNESEWNILKELTTPNVEVAPWERENLGIKDLGFVTYASFDHLTEAFVSCNTIRAHPELINVPLTVYLSPDVTDDLIEMYKKNCPQAKFVMFPFEKFPDRVKDLNNYIFKPLYIAMAMRNHKVLLSFDSSIFFVSNANITNLIQTAVKENPTDVSLLRTAYHSNFLTTHPKMYDCFPDIKPNDMQRVVQYNGGLVLWVGSEEGWTAMHRWVECALQPTCMAPLGATKTCDVKNQSPTKFSGCHRFDQAAINLILYEYSNFTTNLYQRNTNYFKIIRRRNLIPKPINKGTKAKTTIKSKIETTSLMFSTSMIPQQLSSSATKSNLQITEKFTKSNEITTITPSSIIPTTPFSTTQITMTKNNKFQILPSTAINEIEFELPEEKTITSKA